MTAADRVEETIVTSSAMIASVSSCITRCRASLELSRARLAKLQAYVRSMEVAK